VNQIIVTNGNLRFTANVKGPDDGQVVLLLHGFPDNPDTFSAQLQALANAGYRAIAPTMRGYEPSSQPEDDDYRIGAMARDVLAWLDGLGVEKAHLVGHDWGAAVAYVAGALAPDRFHSLTTMAVPHAPRLHAGLRRVPSQVFRIWYMSFFQLRGIADWVIQLKDWAFIKWLCGRWSPGFDVSEDHWASRRTTLEAVGVKTAALAYYRQNVGLDVMLRLTASEALTLATVPVRTLAMGGEKDGCMDVRLYDHVFLERDFPAGIEVNRIAGAGHFMHIDAPTVVNEVLLEWLQRGDSIKA
jgi:pimeloyl-ACP methyl ester carboxylesterase